MRHASRTGALALVAAALQKQKRQFTTRKRFRYAVPSLWAGLKGVPRAVNVDPFDYYLGMVRAAMKARARRRAPVSGGEWTRDAVIYNMFVRTTTAFDHNRNGTLDLPGTPEGFRETGTFLKAIAMLPYIKRLGANTVHLLPVTAIGQDGNKGTLGSPYAIRNPYTLDETLSEPVLGLGAETEFQAFVEAAHRFGMRVVVEFVFRTAAKDADWVKEHPGWFYWIRDEIALRDPHHPEESRYGSPLFTREELDRIHHHVSEHRFDDLTAPHPVYREMFTPPPAATGVTMEGGRYVGTLEDGRRVKIPGAFADWPPDDNQPPWGDVTYLRLYDHPGFNYIAYNTIRMYDTRLTTAEHVNRPLWEKITGIIPHYQKRFGIDGVMIDMGHALPMDLKSAMVRTAREGDPDFAFWDENFSVTRRSREEGYNAVFGFCWIDEHHPPRMKNLARRLQSEGFPIPFFATPENHNTPRAAARPGGLAYARWSWVVNSFLPAIPFIHSGFELGERYPINTGLDFSSEQIRQFPSEKLPLFSEYAYDWLSRCEFTRFLAAVSAVRERYRTVVVNDDPRSFMLLHDENEQVFAFARTGVAPRRRIAVVTSTDYSGDTPASVRLETPLSSVKDLLSGRVLKITEGRLVLPLGPGQCLVFEF